ncbi:MAG: hypothetical protein E5Y74_13185 [Mesorhizobium sp.]|nr:hypothetical protein EOB59_05985 [Mesorhizobium sp. M7A.F.Ca.MR.176.00.0.0]RWN97762.1 MAG: hypothetical protein EOS05_07650 [Mesorhizobium sp.]RWO82804.1 MAG: hypothetical protein EOQ96_22935 [Mesorhizobium sp.]RWO96547.1 MAG: hypothetical protein EOQ97_29955 [Mesorhizobium sp.]RWP86753.1 MAG: hypothetical protein EOR11_15530 [Mesorhizobium sp.]
MHSGAPPSALPGISPSSGEIGRHLRFLQFSTSQDRRQRRSCQSPPLRGVRTDPRSGREANCLAFRTTNARSGSEGPVPVGQRGVFARQQPVISRDLFR